MNVQTVVKACKLAATPVTKLGNAVLANSVKRLKFADGEFATQVSQHKAAGTDLAAQASRDFVTLQFKLIPYRIERFYQETCYFASGQWLKTIDASQWYKYAIFEIRFVLRLFVCYMLFVLLGRRSIYPPLTPTSPFLEQMKYTNPNM